MIIAHVNSENTAAPAGKLAVLWLASLVLALAVTCGCGSKQSLEAASPMAGKAEARPPAPVVVSTAERRDVPVEITAIGNVEAYQTVQIRSQVNGQIEAIHFKEGDDVHKGQLLFALDKRPFQAALAQAQGNLKRDEALAETSKLEAARYSRLESQGVVSHEQADLERTQASSNSAAVYADEAAVDAARVQLAYTDIYAPIDARAGALMINLGNLVKANDTPFLVQLNQITPIYVTFTVPEARLAEVRHFAATKLTALAYPKGQNSNPAQGLLSFIDNSVDPQTGTIKLKASFPNRDRRLWPGQFANVVLRLSTRDNVITVPTKAVETGQQGDYVYVVSKDEIAIPRPIITVGTYQNLTLLNGGLNPGDTVVVDGQLRVTPNGKVRVESSVPPSSVVGSENNSSDSATGTGGGGV
ncbi:MAG: efflux RND transporter periplasmic adaptor subunit [Acidobacteria bacterium]|nr:efflux RND transporter periplasmic adaptor subunit [Acidobacteriota bacterium]